MPQVKWRARALADIARLHSFLHAKHPQAAMRMAQTLLKGAESLHAMPRIGYPMQDDTGRRELFLPFAAGAYVLRYKEDKNGAAVILRVWHSREYR